MAKDKKGTQLAVGDLITGKCPELPYTINAQVLAIDDRGDRVQIAPITHASSMVATTSRHCLVVCYIYWIASTEFTKIAPPA